MAIADGAPAGQITRGRGGFYRSSQDVPYVSDPSGALVKSGDRKGMPKRLAYGSASGFGKQIESTYNLQKWSERRVVMGVGIDLAVIADCAVIARMDPETDEFKEAADRIVVRLKDAAKVSLAADRGTHGHALTEDHDEERDWITRAEAGEILGLDVDVQRSLVQAWNDMLAREGLEILAVESSCVHDGFRTAGTLDRIARLTKPLRFSLITGEIVVISAGTVVVLDVKTGKRRLERNGVVMYWQSYAVQIANYAGGVPYDTEAETRGEWPWPIDQRHALIAHLDVLGALEGQPSCELIYVDIEAGRLAAELVVAAKEWEKRSDVFSIAKLDDADGIEPIAASTAPTVEGERSGTDPAPVPDTISPPAPVPASAAPVENTPAEPARALDWVDTPRELPAAPDEGDDLSGADYAEAWVILEQRFTALDPIVREWTSRIAKEANAAGVSFTTSRVHYTQRRFDIYRGLLDLGEGGQFDDECIRALLAIALDTDAALFPAITVGRALGSLDATTAPRFVEAVHNYLAGQLVGEIDDAQRFVLRELVA